MNEVLNRNKLSSVTMVRIGLLAVMSYLIMFIEVAIPIFPGFLKMDLSDLPAILASLSMGPSAGVFTELIKNLLHVITQGKTAGIGETANFLVGIAYVIPIGFIYKYNRNLKGYILGAFIATIVMVLVASVLNYFIFIPAYSKIGLELEAILEMASKINSNVTDLKNLIILAIAPFNLIKAIIISFLGYLLYDKLKPILNTTSST